MGQKHWKHKELEGCQWHKENRGLPAGRALEIQGEHRWKVRETGNREVAGITKSVGREVVGAQRKLAAEMGNVELRRLKDWISVLQLFSIGTSVISNSPQLSSEASTSKGIGIFGMGYGWPGAVTSQKTLQ